MSGRDVLGLLVAALIAVGCVSSGAQRARYPVEAIPVPDTAGTYSTAARPEGAVGGPGTPELDREVKQLLAEHGARVESDGALADTASFLLREVNLGRSVGPTLLEAASRQFGFAGTASAYATFETGNDSWKEVVTKVPANLPITRYGLCVSPSGRTAALILGNVEVSYETIQRAYEPGQSVTLKGELGPRYRFGHAFLTKPDGTVDKMELSGRALDVTFALTAPGKYQLEVMGDGAMGPQIVTNVPLYVGVPEAPVAGVSGKALDPEEAEKRLLALLNEARRKAGAGPLLPDDELREIALGHSEDMADHDFFGHVSPETGSPENRLKRSGVLVAEFGENIAEADTPEAAHEGLMNSPGHRAVLLKPEFTHVGIAVVEHEGGLVVTFNFGRRVPAASLPGGTPQVEAAIAALRAKKGVPPARLDPVYRSGAQAGAARLADGAEDADVAKAVGAAIQREVERLRTGRPGSCTVIIELLDLAQLESVQAFSDAGLRALGVGTKVRTNDKGSRLSTVIVFEGGPCK